jgi:hypothetical protein
MAQYYTYVIASLPMLIFGAKPPFSYERLLQLCEGFIPEKERLVLAEIPHTDEHPYRGIHSTLDTWYEFDRDLRNELVKIRAARRKVDPLKYVRLDDGYVEPYITHIALHVCRNVSVLEAEKALDQERWDKLEEIAAGHFFDFDSLVVYALKLLILLRWENIRLAERGVLLDNTLKAVEAGLT